MGRAGGRFMHLHFFVSRAILCGIALSAASSLSSAQNAPAQNWPQHTVRVITPLGPGSGMDIAARLFAVRLSQKWGQPVVVENRQGADGILAVQSFLTDRDNHSLIFGFARPDLDQPADPRRQAALLSLRSIGLTFSHLGPDF